MRTAFALGAANPLRASVMYPPDRALFAPFRSARSPRETLAAARGPVVLYAHVPFCETKCSYCDYETVPLAAHDAASRARYAGALCAELVAISAALPAGIEVAGFDIGGGTPGALDAAQFEAIARTVRERFTLAPGFEISTETTPTLAAGDPEKWRRIAAAGISRVSMGVQTADPVLLGRLHRAPHTGDRARDGMRVLRAAGFAMINVDLMFALPSLTLQAWSRTLDLALDLEPDVVTVYDTVYKNRGIAKQASRWNAVPSPGDYLAQYDLAFARLTRAGYSARYGSVNFSRVAGRLGTSRYLEGRILEGFDYAGAGLYASSLVRDTWRFNPRRYEDWISRGDLAAEDLYELPVAHVMAKFLLLALSYGYLDAARFERRFGESLAARFGAALAFATARGLLRPSDDGWELVPGSFGALPAIRALFYPADALPFLGNAVV